MHTQVAVDTQIMRGINTSAILGVLRGEARMSVSDLSERTGLSRQAVTRALAALEAGGLVEFTGPDAAEPRSGRPAQLVRFRAEAGLVLGASVTPREVRIVIADLNGAIASDRSEPMSPTDPVRTVSDAIRRALENLGASSEDVRAAAIGTPGIVDTEVGFVRFIPSLTALQGDVLAHAVGDLLQCPVEIDNDLNLATEGELWRGGLQDVRSMVLIEWGERVGAGLVLNGALYRGASNDAGDVGFVPVITQTDEPTTADPGQPLGPFESWVGARAIVAATVEAALEHSDADLSAALADADDASGLEVVLRAAENGNVAALQAVATICRRFATGLWIIRAVLDPQLVLIGGPVARFGDILLNRLRHAVAEGVLNPPAIELSALGDDAIVQGAIHRALVHVESTQFAPHAVTDWVTPSARQNTK